MTLRTHFEQTKRGLRGHLGRISGYLKRKQPKTCVWGFGCRGRKEFCKDLYIIESKRILRVTKTVSTMKRLTTNLGIPPDIRGDRCRSSVYIITALLGFTFHWVKEPGSCNHLSAKQSCLPQSPFWLRTWSRQSAHCPSVWLSASVRICCEQALKCL